MNIDLQKGNWISKPRNYKISADKVEIITDPRTDFWQRSYYGFRNDNAPALLFDSAENFTFSVKISFDYKERFDQCGIIIYLDSNNWFKASIEYENNQYSRLGSVVTNLGYSDWATNDIKQQNKIWYRLSRRGPDFLSESSFDGIEFKQMRIFHMHLLGETTVEMGQADPPLIPKKPVKFGIYACSPSDSSFKAEFSNFCFSQSKWKAHSE